MCVPGCQDHVFRGFRAVTSSRAPALWRALPQQRPFLPSRPAMAMPGFSKVVDLTHTFDDKFPTFGGTPGIKLNKVFDFEKEWLQPLSMGDRGAFRHHMDARSISRRMARALPKSRLSKLVVPLCVIDISPAPQRMLTRR